LKDRLGWRKGPRARSRANRKHAHPGLEALEGRLLLYATTGYAWQLPGRITYSFAPDGALWARGTNTMNADFAAQFGGQDWKQAFRSAFAKWEAATNIQFVEIGDTGVRWDSTGQPQGDPRAGDIRIGGVRLGPTTLLAETTPPFNYRMDGGTIQIVTDQSFSYGSTNGAYNLERVALHEIGRALGLADSDVPGVIMSSSYNGTRTLQPDDIAGIRSLYGAPVTASPRPGSSSDFDGDGISDMGMFLPQSALWSLSLTRGQRAPDFQFGASSYQDIPVPGDYDGTGTTQFAVFRPSTGAWVILHGDGTQTEIFYGAGNLQEIPVPGDYDGDGRTNIAVYNPSIAEWHILNHDGSQTYVQYGWAGLENEIPVPGDYDGDGKTDIAVYRQSIAEWHILNSATPTQTFIQYGQAGLTNEIPVPGDYDGDGRTEIAVFNVSLGEWHILLRDGTQRYRTYGGPGMSTRIPIQAPIGSLKALNLIPGPSQIRAQALATSAADPENPIQSVATGLSSVAFVGFGSEPSTWRPVSALKVPASTSNSNAVDLALDLLHSDESIPSTRRLPRGILQKRPSSLAELV